LEGKIESFFFIRYALEGPHIRLRLRTRLGVASIVDEMLYYGSSSFFAHSPSQEHIDVDPLYGYGDYLQPNNSLKICDFDPEVERYGGPNLIGHSLDFFALSSVETLSFLATYGQEPRSCQLATMFRLLLSQAWGFARGEDEFWLLLDYMPTFQAYRAGGIPERTEEVLASNREALFQLFQDEVAKNLTVPTTGLAEAARRLSVKISNETKDVRRLVHASQMHMTANRLGLKNAEEIYLGLLMKRTGEELSKSDPSFRDFLSCALSTPRAASGSLSDLLVERLRSFCAAPEDL
jgi:hypothetical protein